MLQDLRLGARVFRRHLGLAAAAVLSLALGIGANTAIFSVLHNVVLGELPYEEPDRLVIVWETSATNPERWVAPANFIDWRRETRAFESLAAFDEFSPTLSGRGEPERLRALGVSGNYFATLGASAAFGRALTQADDAADAPGVAVLSHGLWTRLYGASRDAVGTQMLLDGRSYTIVGVMPAAFASPLQSAAIDLWLSGDRGVPRTFPFGGDLTAVRDSHIITVVGRLRPEATRQAAQQELTTLMAELARRHPDTNGGLGANVVPLHQAVVGSVSSLVWLLQLAVGMMLLIACANVAHLLLGQAAERRGEITMRLALGAGRARILRQLLAETLVIAVPGGVLGLLLAIWGLDVLVSLAPQALPRLSEIAVNIPVLAFTLGATLATAAIFGLGPAFQLTRGISQTGALVTTRVAGERQVRRWHHALVVTELALAQVLLIGAGLLLASFAAIQRVELGYALEGRAAADLSLAPDRYLAPVPGSAGGFTIDPAAKLQFVEAVLDRLRSAPRVRAAAASFTSPLAGAPNRGVDIPGRPARGAGQQDAADFQVITPEYFRTVGATLVRGRAIEPTDQANTPAVTVVNQAFVDRYFPGEDPIGRQIRFGGSASHRIVGIVADMRYRSVEQAPDPAFYIPITQNAERWPFMSFTVAMDGDAESGVPLLRDAIRAADPHQAITRVRTYEAILANALAPRRFNTLLVGAFALAALLLAAVGTYGVMAYAVASRTREIGVRAALGATPRDLLRLVMGQGLLLAFIAVALGIAGGLAATRLLTTMLFGVAPRDPQTFALVGGLLTLVALVATWIPARRAVRVNPVSALRDE